MWSQPGLKQRKIVYISIQGNPIPTELLVSAVSKISPSLNNFTDLTNDVSAKILSAYSTRNQILDVII